MKKKKDAENYAEELKKSHEHWDYIYLNGCNDPFWEDGVNLNLIHNHICYYRRMIEVTTFPENYPEIYHKPIPPQVDQRYMARKDEIRVNAKISLNKYKDDSNFQYIVKHYSDYTPKTRKKLCIDNVISYVTGLEHFIKEDMLVDMRRHENYSSYLKSFERCAKEIKATPPESYQLSLFSNFDNLIENDDDEYEME